MEQASPGPGSEHAFLLSSSRPNRRQKAFAASAIALLLAAMLLVAPFAPTPVANTEILVPVYAAAVFTNEVITAALLFALFAIRRSPAILALAVGYLFSGFMAAPWALSIPGVLPQLGLPDVGQQTTAWIATLRRLGFPLFVLAYALLRGCGEFSAGRMVPVIMVGCVAAVATASGGLAWMIIEGKELLPHLTGDTKRISSFWFYLLAVALVVYATVVVLLWRFGRTVLDLWLIVVICALSIELVLLSIDLVHQSLADSRLRLSLGWWAGRLYSLAASGLVLLVLLAEAASLSARLALSVVAERRAHEAQLVTLQAFSASIAHEINQPLASMVTNADAGLRWLAREKPELDEAAAALARIARDGDRASKVVDGIRTMFSKGGQDYARLDVNELLRGVLDDYREACRTANIVIQTRLAEDLPAVFANRVQVEQVACNLVANAIDAMRSAPAGQRVLRVKSAMTSRFELVFSVEDSGTGLAPAHRDRLFEPFFTTKAGGLGIGLTVSRLILESHGGRLWATDNSPRGAVFQFTLPCTTSLGSSEEGTVT
jgi:signal transduction histidine kinase